MKKKETKKDNLEAKKAKKEAKTTKKIAKKQTKIVKKSMTKKTVKEVKTSKIRSFWKSFSDNTPKLKKKDFIILGVLMVFYLIISFYHLGTFKTPKTYYHFTYANEEAGVEIDGVSQNISKIRYYTGPEVGEFSVMTSTDGKTYKEAATMEEKSVFAWEDLIIDESLKYIKFVAKSSNIYLGEVQLYNKYGEKVKTIASDDQSAVITDESNTVPVQISSINSSYFDEIYFARSAYEYAHGIDTMEWVHPPLGKLIMMIPIILFGMSTFSYRLMGTLAGCAMIPVLYILAKRMFKSRKFALLAGILMTFDCFHFAQTRMGTVDSFLVLFIMLSSLFMYQYIDLDNDAKLKTKLKNLFWSGLFIGCAICTKWTGLYAGLGLAIIFFGDLIYKSIKSKKIKNINTQKIVLVSLFLLCILPIAIYYFTVLFAGVSLAIKLTIAYYLLSIIIGLIYYLVKVDRQAVKIILACVLFFIVIPMIMYILCYLLFPTVYNYADNSISGIINQIKDMYKYHSTLTEGHAFSSKWYTWPFMIKPVWYYVAYYGGNVKATIVGIGNPAIWWFGALAAIYTLIASIVKKNKENLFIIVLILCTWLPYLFIGRAMFMYHFFPTLPFIMLAIVSFIKWITKKIGDNSFYIFYVAVVILLFAIFYPVVSGVVTTSDYVDSIKWLSTWIF